MLPKFWSLFPLPSSLPKIGVVVDLVEKIPPLAAAQANQRFKPTGTRGSCLKEKVKGFLKRYVRGKCAHAGHFSYVDE